MSPIAPHMAPSATWSVSFEGLSKCLPIYAVPTPLSDINQPNGSIVQVVETTELFRNTLFELRI